MKKEEYRFKQAISFHFYVPLILGVFTAILGLISIKPTMLFLALLIVFIGVLYSAFFIPDVFDYNIVLYKDYIIIESLENGKQRINIPFKMYISDSKRKLLLYDDENEVSIFFNDDLLQFLMVVASGH